MAVSCACETMSKEAENKLNRNPSTAVRESNPITKRLHLHEDFDHRFETRTGGRTGCRKNQSSVVFLFSFKKKVDCVSKRRPETDKLNGFVRSLEGGQ